MLPGVPKKKCKKLVSVSVTSILVIGTREKAVETAKTADATEVAKTVGANKNGKKSESEYLKYLAQVLYIQYPITF